MRGGYTMRLKFCTVLGPKNGPCGRLATEYIHLSIRTHLILSKI